MQQLRLSSDELESRAEETRANSLAEFVSVLAIKKIGLNSDETKPCVKKTLSNPNSELVFVLQIKDAIHDMIQITEDEKRVLDTKVVQRSRSVEQLSGCSNVFSCAKGDRFSHVLGALQISGEYGRKLYPKDYYTIRLLRMCALLHDVAHGPYSHSYDASIYESMYGPGIKGHDVHRFKILQENDELREAVLMSGLKLQDIFDCWSGKNRVHKAIVQGPAGADRLDFIMRDAYFCGVHTMNKGIHRRIIEGSEIVVDPKDGKLSLSYNNKVMDDVYTILSTRFNMYKGIYGHKTCTASKAILDLMLKSLLGYDEIKKITNDANQFHRLTDDYIKGFIDFEIKDPESLSKKYLNAYRYRKLPKMVYEATVDTGFHKSILDILQKMTSGNYEKALSGCDEIIRQLVEYESVAWNVQEVERLKNTIENIKQITMDSIDNGIECDINQFIFTYGVQLSLLDMKNFDELNILVSSYQKSIQPIQRNKEEEKSERNLVQQTSSPNYKITRTRTIKTPMEYIEETNFMQGLEQNYQTCTVYRIYHFLVLKE